MAGACHCNAVFKSLLDYIMKKTTIWYRVVASGRSRHQLAAGLVLSLCQRQEGGGGGGQVGRRKTQSPSVHAKIVNAAQEDVLRPRLRLRQAFLAYPPRYVHIERDGTVQRQITRAKVLGWFGLSNNCAAPRT